MTEYLARFDVESFLKRPQKLTDERKAKLERIVGELEETAMNVEQQPFRILKVELAQYPVIDISFLEMSIPIEYEGTQIQVPRFSVYQRSKEGFAPFGVSFSKSFDNFLYHPSLTFNIPSLVMCSPLARSSEFYKYDKSPEEDNWTNSRRFKFDRNQIPPRVLRKYKQLGNFDIKTEFQGIIPQETKKKINEAGKILETYLVSETRPEQWKKARPTRDPLLIGVDPNTETCYLIEKFNTTPLEDYVSREFTR